MGSKSGLLARVIEVLLYITWHSTLTLTVAGLSFLKSTVCTCISHKIGIGILCFSFHTIVP